MTIVTAVEVFVAVVIPISDIMALAVIITIVPALRANLPDWRLGRSVGKPPYIHSLHRGLPYSNMNHFAVVV